VSVGLGSDGALSEGEEVGWIVEGAGGKVGTGRACSYVTNSTVPVSFAHFLLGETSKRKQNQPPPSPSSLRLGVLSFPFGEAHVLIFFFYKVLCRLLFLDLVQVCMSSILFL